MPDNDGQCLIVVMGEELELLLAGACPERGFTARNRVFNDLGYGDFLGFYDWLRNPQRHVIGVRHHIFDEFKLPFGKLGNLPYAEVTHYSKVITLNLYFGTERGFDEESSDDQRFTDNRAYKSEHDEYALSFDAEGVVDALSHEALRKCRRV